MSDWQDLGGAHLLVKFEAHVANRGGADKKVWLENEEIHH